MIVPLAIRRLDHAPYQPAHATTPRKHLEGGPTLAGSFLAAGLIDRVVAYIAPVLIGGGGKSALAGPGALNIADAKRFRLEDVVRIGPDVRLTASPLS